jgi:hypothetical protein
MDTRKFHEFFTFVCAHCGRTISVPRRCPGRTCEICNVQRAIRIRSRMRFLCQNIEKRRGAGWKHWVFTMRSEDDLEAMLDHLLRSFRKIRQRPWWKTYMYGGAYVVEATHGEKGWHAHLHVLVYCLYFPHHRMVREWQRTSGSAVVWVTKPPQARIANYLTKYITKVECDVTHQWEIDSAFAHRRLWSPFGCCHDLMLKYTPSAHPCPDCGSTEWVCPDFMHWSEWNVRSEPYRAPP